METNTLLRVPEDDAGYGTTHGAEYDAPLKRSDGSHAGRGRWMASTTRVGTIFVGAAALFGCYAASAGRGSAEWTTLGIISEWGFKQITAPSVTFTLDASWIKRETKQANSAFFSSPLSEAYVLRHNYGSSSFFEQEDKIQMTRVGLRKWTLTTTEVNYEYGFMLRNENGDYLREIGASYTNDREPVLAPASTMGNCTVQFGQYRNRLIPQKDGVSTHDIKACFGMCTEECELPDAPAALATLEGTTYTGGSTWGSANIQCNLGSETVYDNARQAMYINGNEASLIVCPFDISPSVLPEVTIEIVFMLDDCCSPSETRGWIFGHDNGGYDRSFIISDSRFGGGVAMGIGSAYNSGIPTPTEGVWHHGLAVFRQGVAQGSYTALDGKVAPVRATANNDDGLSSFSIGGLVGFNNHNMKGYVKYFNFYEGALSEDQVEALYVSHTPYEPPSTAA